MASTEEQVPEVVVVPDVEPVVVPDVEPEPDEEEIAHAIRFEALKELRAVSDPDTRWPNGVRR